MKNKIKKMKSPITRILCYPQPLTSNRKAVTDLRAGKSKLATEMHVPGRRSPAVQYKEFFMAKADQPTQQFHFQKSDGSSRVTVFNNLRYIMAEYDANTGVTRWTRVVAAAQRENVQQWLLKNYPVGLEVPTPVRRKKAA
jgi:hypothetical protein